MRRHAVALLLAVWAASPAGAAPELPAYHLHIAGQALRELEAFRERIEDLDFLPPSERKWVSAMFVAGDARYRVRLRIRGDLPAHWRGAKHSYRLKFGDRLFEGRKEINLIVPGDKHFGVELLQTRIAEDLGLAFFPGRFVNLTINDRDVGLYYESEHPTRQWLERTGRAPSSIFTFAFNWTVFFGKRYHHIEFFTPGSLARLPIEGLAQIKQRRTFDPDDEELAARQRAYVAAFYRLLTEGSPEQIAARAPHYLDLRSFAKYVALQDYFGSSHAMELNDNIRLYLDPTSGRFEFMPWDTRLMPLAARIHGSDGVPGDLLVPKSAVFRRLFEAIPGLSGARDAALATLVARADDYHAELNRIHAELLALYPDDERLRTKSAHVDVMFAENAQILRRYLARAPR